MTDIIQRRTPNTTPAANPLTGPGTATENLQNNAIQQMQMRRYQENKNRLHELRAQAAARKANLEHKQIVREHVQVGKGYTTRTSQKTMAELGAKAEGEKLPDPDIIMNLEKAFEVKSKGQRADTTQTGIYIHQFENFLHQEEVRKYNEDISFDRANRLAFALNSMPAPDPNRYQNPAEQSKPLTQAERDKLVLKAQDKTATVAQRRAAMAALAGTTEGKYETAQVSERQTNKVQSRLDARIRLNQALGLGGTSPKSEPIPLTQAVGREDILNKARTATNGTETRAAMNWIDKYAPDIAATLTLSSAALPSVFDKLVQSDNPKAYKLLEAAKNQSEFTKSLEKHQNDIYFSQKALLENPDILSQSENAKSILSGISEITPTEKNLLAEFFSYPGEVVSQHSRIDAVNHQIEKYNLAIESDSSFSLPDWWHDEISKANISPSEKEQLKSIQDIQVTKKPFVAAITSDEIERVNKGSQDLGSYLKELKDSGTMWKKADKQGSLPLSVKIIGGTEMIQTAGNTWLDERQADVNSVIMKSPLPDIARAGLLINSDFARGFLSFPLLFQSMALAAPATRFAVQHPKDFANDFVPGVTYAATEMADYAVENPVKFSGEMTGMIFGPKALKLGFVGLGKGTGLVRGKTFGYDNVPYMARGEQVETILIQDFVTGARAVSAPEPGNIMRSRTPSSIGDVGNYEGAFATIARPEIEPYGKWFLNKDFNPLSSVVNRPQIYIFEEVPTVASEVSPVLREQIFQSIKTKGDFQEFESTLYELAAKKSAEINKPVAVPSPKRMFGEIQPESEMHLHFGNKVSRQMNKRFVGVTEDLVPIYKVSFGNAPKPTAEIPFFLENLKYNLNLGYGFGKVYNRNHLSAMSRDMIYKYESMYGGRDLYPSEYSSHGLTHAESVGKRMLSLKEESASLKKYSDEQLLLRGKLHDLAKIEDLETEPISHAEATGLAIKEGLLDEAIPGLKKITSFEKNQVARDIALHTKASPLLRLLQNPSPGAMALATADRQDLVRFGIAVKQRKLFLTQLNKNENPKTKQLNDFLNGERDLPIGFKTKFTTDPIPADVPEIFRNKFNPKLKPQKVKSNYPIKEKLQSNSVYPGSQKYPLYPTGYNKGLFRSNYGGLDYTKDVATYNSPISKLEYSPLDFDYKVEYPFKKKYSQNKINSNYPSGYSPGKYSGTSGKGDYPTGASIPFTTSYAGAVSIRGLPQGTKNIRGKSNKKRDRKDSTFDIFHKQNVEIPILRGKEALTGEYNPLELTANKKTFAQLGNNIFDITGKEKRTVKKLKSKSKPRRK